ncbi:MAG: DUF6321 domain-containing protein [Bryobacteraceae bacterium]
MAKTPVWQRAAGKSKSGGLNDKGRASLRAAGHDIKPPVSKEQASKSDASAKRRDNFRSRMCGMKKKLTGAKAAADPNSRINKALRRWDVKC